LRERLEEEDLHVDAPSAYAPAIHVGGWPEEAFSAGSSPTSSAAPPQPLQQLYLNSEWDIQIEDNGRHIRIRPWSLNILMSLTLLNNDCIRWQPIPMQINHHLHLVIHILVITPAPYQDPYLILREISTRLE